MKKFAVVLLIAVLSLTFFGCGDYTKEEAVKLTSEAVGAALSRDFSAEFTVKYSTVKPSEAAVLNTTDFDEREVAYKVLYDAETGRYYEETKEGDNVEKRIYTAADGFIGTIITKCTTAHSGSDTDTLDVLAVKRGKTDRSRYYYEELTLIDADKAFEKAISKKETRLVWSNISVMTTEAVNFTVTEGELTLLEYYFEKIEQRENKLALSDDNRIVGMVTQKTAATVYITYGEVEIPTI